MLSAFKSSAACVAVDIGLSTSAVLSALPKPKCCRDLVRVVSVINMT